MTVTAVDPFVVALTDPASTEVSLVGTKAAALAVAARAGLPVLPGWVLTTAFTRDIDAGADIATHPAVRQVFEAADGGSRSLVARSSSVSEDTAASSMAGQFASVIGIEGFEAFAAAVREVLDSRLRVRAAGEPIAVLVQPLLDAAIGGVMFGVDPVSGRSDLRVVTAVHGGPEPLVSGEVEGSRYVVDERNRVVEYEAGDGPKLARRDLARLGELAAKVEQVFGGPQDVEWAIDTEGTLWLLQSRPVTTEIRGRPVGPVYGPGPVAETFPEPLTELESDLWVPPLRDAVREAVLLTGAAKRERIDASELVISVQGHVAIDLELSGEFVERPSLLQRLNPVPAVRHLRIAWRVGRLRAAIPALSERLLDRADADLEAVPALAQLSSRQLVALVRRGRGALRSLHAHEMLMGMLLSPGTDRMTGASVALRVLVEARRDGLSDKEILERSPIVLALTPPRVAADVALPETVDTLELVDGSGERGDDNGLLREALRLRVRWLQELTARAMWELGVRLTERGELRGPETVRHMSFQTVEALATRLAVTVPPVIKEHEHDFGERLPAAFQLSDLGKPIPVREPGRTSGGTGAGGGVGVGVVTHNAEDPPDGSVLVTTTLTPGLGPLLPRLRGIVAETGSVLSHLAILARESGVPTVVGFHDATKELPEGVRVKVDGHTGEVDIVEEDPA